MVLIEKCTKKHIAKTRITQQGSGQTVRVQPGEYYVGQGDDLTIVTILGSCVAACIRNPLSGFGGMNHFMLPENDEGHWGGVSSVMRYGNHAMETLINEVVKSGCPRNELEIKLFGGANMYEGSVNIGHKNAEFAQKYLLNDGLKCVAFDLGGNLGRRIHYSPATGKVKRLLLSENQNITLTRSESRLAHKIKAPKSGDIELFD